MIENSPHAQNNLPITDKFIYEVDPQFPPEMIDSMLASVRKADRQPGGVRSAGEVTVDTNIRKSDVSFLCWDHWVAGILHNLFISANNDYFHFDLDHFDSGIQTTYYKEGDHYTWHSDASGIHTPSGYERKLSMSFLLTDDYKGGELEFELKPKTSLKKPKAGTAIIFPSWLAHRVKPVEEGERISLVAWMNGPNFK